MKKQKKPIVLVLLLAALFGGVAFMNRPAPKLGDENPQQQQPDQTAKSETAKDVANDVSKALDEPVKMSTPQAHGNHGGPTGPNGAGGIGSSMIKVDHGPTKPKPNTSSTSAQWYTDEANKK